MYFPQDLGRARLSADRREERLVRSGARFATKAMVLSAASNDAAIKIAVRRIRPTLVLERLWKETGCRACGSRRRTAADRARRRGALTHRKCRAEPPARRELPCRFSCLVNRTVEDGFERSK
jgi:hypothetical protein